MLKQEDINTLKCGMVKNTLSYIRSLLHGIECKRDHFLDTALTLYNFYKMVESPCVCELDSNTKLDIIECVNELNRTNIINNCNNC